MKALLVLLVCAALAGCTSVSVQSPQLAAAHGDRPGYEELDCARLGAEADSLARRESQLVLAQAQRLEATKGQAAPGDGQAGAVEASGLADVRGEREAVRVAMESKQCPGVGRSMARSHKFPPFNAAPYFTPRPQQRNQVH